MGEIMLSNFEADVNFEHKIKLFISKYIKSATGKGPINTNVILLEKTLLVNISGFLAPGDIKVAETEEGSWYVKQYHMRRINALREEVCQEIKLMTGNTVREFFYDVNPETNEGIIVIYLN